MRKILILVALAVFMPFFLRGAAVAAEKEKQAVANLAIRAGEHAEFDRLVFDCPRKIPYKLSRSGEKAVITFGALAKINLRPAKTLSRISNLAVNQAQNDGKLSLSFNVSPQSEIKDFTSGNSIVLDVYNPKPQKKYVETTKEKTEVQPKQESAPEKPAQENKTEESPALSPVPEPAPQTAVEQQKEETSFSFPELGSEPKLIVSLDPKIETGAAIFSRANYGYVIFDKKFSLDAATLVKNNGLSLSFIPLILEKYSGFRFPVPPSTELRAAKNGTEWQIFIAKKQSEITVSTGLSAQPDFALGARLFLSTPNPPDPVSFRDPIVGDELIALPLHEKEAFSASRRFADLSLVPAAQGMVIKPLQEKLSVRALSDGIEITSEGGLKLSPSVDTGSSQKLALKSTTPVNVKTVFDVRAWRGKKDSDFNSSKQSLMQTIVDVPEAQKNLARLELAKFYFSYGMGEESLSLLKMLENNVPDLPSHREFLALRGAAKILAGHSREGLQDLGEAEYSAQPEIHLWQAVGLAQMRDWAGAEEKFNLSENLLVKYPEPFYSKFSILAVEAAVATGKDREATDWLTRLETGEYMPQIKPAMLYLRGVLRSKSGFAETAEALWKEVTRSNDRLYKIRAELALIDLGVATKSLTPAQAVERLEGLRFAWRGDDLELDILRRLGNFYIEAKNFKAGLSALAKAASLYPESPLVSPIRSEMAKTFRDLFLASAGADLSPVEALTLYQDYSDLMPQGEDGIVAVRNLSDRLVSIDLLDQAAKLLEDQLKTGIKGEERAKSGTKLAVIYLLNHRPDAALSALDSSGHEGISAELSMERKLLRARTLSEQKKFDDAFELLSGNENRNAKLLKADIAMKAQRWEEASKVMLEIVGAPPKPGYLLTEEQAQILVNCAISMSMGNDLAGLDRLAIDFGAAMAGTSQSDTFRVLTRPEKAGQMRDIAAAQAKITEVDMFRGFLDSYRNISGAPTSAPSEKSSF